jgi:hypothetical protein
MGNEKVHEKSKLKQPICRLAYEHDTSTIGTENAVFLYITVFFIFRRSFVSEYLTRA